MAEKKVEEDVLDDEEHSGTVYLETHEKLNQSLCGDIEELSDGYARIRLTTSEDMRADHLGLVHGGFTFSSADFAAMAAVNDPNVVLTSSKCTFLSPVRVGDEIVFDAAVRHKEGRKRDVYVRGFVSEVKVFEGEFRTVITEKHVLKLKLIETSENIQKK